MSAGNGHTYIVKTITFGAEKIENYMPAASCVEVGEDFFELRLAGVEELPFRRISRADRWVFVYPASGALLDKYPPIPAVPECAK